MATINLSNITSRGTKAVFLEKMATAPNVYEKHCMIVPSDAPDENYVWPGMLPVPREMVSGRNLQGMMDFTLTLANKEYELSILIARKTVADDRHRMLDSRIRQIAEAFATFRDNQFATLLSEGDTLTDTYDGSAFHHATRTIGESAAIDNLRTSDITNPTTTGPTAAEVLLGLQDNIPAMARYQDDKGRPAYNALAMRRLAAILPPEYERGFVEAINSTLLSQSDNPWGNQIVEIDILPYLPALGTDAAYYLSALGAERKPFLFQEREPLEVIVYSKPDEIAENNGLKILCYERSRFGYGEFRRNQRHDYT